MDLCENNGLGGLGFNFWANVLICLGGRSRAEGAGDRSDALGTGRELTLLSGETAGKSGGGGLSRRR